MPVARRRSMIRVIALTVLAALFIGRAASAQDDPEIARLRLAQRTHFTDTEITDGFFKVTLGAEFHTGGRIDRIRKYDVPVRVHIDNRAVPDRRSQVQAAIDMIGRHIRGLDIAVTDKVKAANVQVALLHDRHLNRTIREVFGAERARRIRRSLYPQCLSGFRRDDSYRIVQSAVLLVADVSDFVFYDCVYEELLQALGPINDDASVPWSMFNDDVRLGFFGIYDQYLLNILYHPRVRPGMTRAEVQAVLPEVLPEVRAFVTEVNGLGK